MTSSLRISLGFGLLLLVPALALVAAERRVDKNTAPAGDAVEMFAAMKSKEIEVKVIPKDETELRVMITNNTRKPLNVKLPEAFAATPVLHQIGGGARPGAPAGGQQAAGGGMGMGMGMGGMGMGGGMMNIAPEKTANFKVTTVCLEHGKKVPRPGIPYEIKPLESFTTKPEVKALLTALGNGKMNQRAAQVAAWHLANGMTFEQLAAKRIEHLDGSSEQWFSREEIQAGMQVAQLAVAEAAQKKSEKTEKSPGEGVTLIRPAGDSE